MRPENMRRRHPVQFVQIYIDSRSGGFHAAPGRSAPLSEDDYEKLKAAIGRLIAGNSRSTRPEMRITSICEGQPTSLDGGTKNECAPDSLSHGTHRLNSPPPKSAHFQINLCPQLRK